MDHSSHQRGANVAICSDPATLQSCSKSTGDGTFDLPNGIYFYNGRAYVVNQVTRFLPFAPAVRRWFYGPPGTVMLICNLNWENLLW